MKIELRKKYKIGKNKYTISELRKGYKIITGLDNGKDFTDDEIYEYMKKAIKE